MVTILPFGIVKSAFTHCRAQSWSFVDMVAWSMVLRFSSTIVFLENIPITIGDIRKGLSSWGEDGSKETWKITTKAKTSEIMFPTSAAPWARVRHEENR